MKLAGTDSPEEADALKGCKLLIRPVDRPPLEDEDEFYAQARSSHLTALLQMTGISAHLTTGTPFQRGGCPWPQRASATWSSCIY